MLYLNFLNYSVLQLLLLILLLQIILENGYKTYTVHMPDVLGEHERHPEYIRGRPHSSGILSLPYSYWSTSSGSSRQAKPYTIYIWAVFIFYWHFLSVSRSATSSGSVRSYRKSSYIWISASTFCCLPFCRQKYFSEKWSSSHCHTSISCRSRCLSIRWCYCSVWSICHGRLSRLCKHVSSRHCCSCWVSYS